METTARLTAVTPARSGLLAVLCAAGLVAAGLLAAGLFAAGLLAAGAVRPPIALIRSATDHGPALSLQAREAISRGIGSADRRYAIVAAGDGAAGAGGGVRAHFARGGVLVSARATALLRLSLTAVSRPGEAVRVTATAPRWRGNQVTYAHGAALERYVNGPAGLEQRFTLLRRPRGSGELTLSAGTLAPGAVASIAAGGTALDVRSGRATLSYSGLAVTDAAGHAVPAAIALAGRRVLLRIDDRGARYPLTVDPLAAGVNLTAPDGFAGAQFGAAVAASGDVIAVGAPDPDESAASHQGEGAVYIFVRPAGGWQTSSTATELTVPGEGPDDAFGASVAISDDTLVVGAPDTKVGSNPYQGAAYVFVAPGGDWTSTTAFTLTAADGTADASFGSSVAISDGTILVGAPADGNGADEGLGTAYVYTRLAGGWATTSAAAELTPADGADGDFFGTSVALDGTTAVVGAPYGGVDAEGGAYVYTEPETGWQATSHAAELSDDIPQDGDFGEAVAISGPTIAVGNGNVVYVFTQPVGGAWASAGASSAALLSASDGSANYFGVSPVSPISPWPIGSSLAISGDTVLVGSAAYENDPPASPAGIGAVYVFQEPAGGWTDISEPASFVVDDTTLYDALGGSVAFAGDGSYVAGAPGSSQNTGRAVVMAPVPFNVTPPTIAGTPTAGDTVSVTGGTWTGNPIGFTDQWEDCTETSPVTCTAIPGATGSSYPVADGDRGSALVAEVTANNDAGPGAEVVTAPLDVPDVPVLNAGGTEITGAEPDGTVPDGTTLTADPGGYANNPQSYAYQWQRCGAGGQSCADIAGVDGQRYAVGPADVGSTLVVTVIAANAVGPSQPSTSPPTDVVVQAPPVNQLPPTISGTALQGATLTEATGAWSNAPSAYAYQWERCDTYGSGCVPVTGATEQTYALAAADVGYEIVVQQDAANSAGSGAPVSSAPTAVVTAAPARARTFPSLTIDGGAYATTTPHVLLSLIWPAGADSALIADTASFSDEGLIGPPTERIPWTLTGASGPKSIYVRFTGTDTTTLSATIVLDRTVPYLRQATLVRRADTDRLRVVAGDAVTGICELAVSRTASGGTTVPVSACAARGVRALTRTFRLRAGTAARYARVRSSAGTWSRWRRITAGRT